MPWSPGDAQRFKRGLSKESQRKWAKVANSALKQYGDESKAIRTANSQVRNSAIDRRLKDKHNSKKTGVGGMG
jgi:hypothetical protein